jgi:hypothetical protein
VSFEVEEEEKEPTRTVFTAQPEVNLRWLGWAGLEACIPFCTTRELENARVLQARPDLGELGS